MKKKKYFLALIISVILLIAIILNFGGSSNPEKLHIKRKKFELNYYYRIMGNIKDDEITNSIVVIPKKYENKKIPVGIGVGAFKNAKNLKEVTLTSNTKYIFSDAFRNSNLEKINIPADSTLTSILEGAFLNTNLTTIFIPKSVVSIGPRAFKGKKGKITIYIEAETIPDEWHQNWDVYDNNIVMGVSHSEYERIINNN